LDTSASHNFITQESAQRMELQLEELKAPIEVHFADGIAHPTKLQAKDVPLQLGNWRGKVDLLVSTLGGMDCILGMELITHNNVLIEGHNRLIRIPSKNGIMRVKAHEMPSVGGTTIHLMLGKNLEKECGGDYGMLCVMRVLDEFEPKEATKVVATLALGSRPRLRGLQGCGPRGRKPGSQGKGIARVRAKGKPES